MSPSIPTFGLSFRNPSQCRFCQTCDLSCHPASLSHSHAHTQFNRWGRSRSLYYWDCCICFLPLANVIHVNVLAAELSWISWIEGDCSKVNKMKQHKLEFVGNIWDWANETFAGGLATSCEQARSGQDVLCVYRITLKACIYFHFPRNELCNKKAPFLHISFQNKSEVCKSDLDCSIVLERMALVLDWIFGEDLKNKNLLEFEHR